MKTPRIQLEWDCDGIGCTKTVRIDVPADLAFPYKNLPDIGLALTSHDLEKLAAGGGCRTLGRATLFCPACSDPQRRAPDSLR